MQLALLGLEAAPRPPRDAVLPAYALQRRGSHSQVLRRLLEVFAEVLLQRIQCVVAQVAVESKV